MTIKNSKLGQMPANSVTNNTEPDVQLKNPTALEIEGWLVSYLAELREINAKNIDVKAPFDRYGLDSSSAVGLTCDLEDWLGRNIDPTLPYDYPTIEALAQQLAEESKRKA